MLDNNARVLTNKGGSHQLPPALHPYLCLTSDKKLYFNKEYADHPQVLNKIAYFREARLFDDMPIALSSTELAALYDKWAKNNHEASQYQRDVSDLFKEASAKEGSDVHFILRKNECIVKIWSIGDLDIVHEYAATHGHALCKTLFMTMCDQAGKTFQPKAKQEARVRAIYLPDGVTGVRVGTSPTDSGYIMVCRLLKKVDPSKLNLDNLGFEPFQVEQINRAKSMKGGINIFAGPTGSGKSTGMAVIVGMIITDSNGTKHVITAENPVEYEIGGSIIVSEHLNGQKIDRKIMSYATQTPVMAGNAKRKKEVFAEAITAMMRLDPDVIVVGEIRDGGSLKAAIDASMTGHQVWTSVHATTAIGIIKRLLTVGSDDDGKVEKDLICDADIISSLTAQRLVKKLCPYCSGSLDKHLQDINPKLLERLNDAFFKDLSGIRIRNLNGCEHCYKGNISRTVVAEIVNCDQKFMELIMTSTYAAEKYWLDKLNGIPMLVHGLLKVKRGIVDPYDLEEELKYIQLPEGLNHEYYKQLLKEQKYLQDTVLKLPSKDKGTN